MRRGKAQRAGALIFQPPAFWRRIAGAPPRQLPSLCAAVVLRGDMPAAFDPLCAAITRCQHQPQRRAFAHTASGFRSQMQPAHGCQSRRVRNFGHHQCDLARTQGFLHRPQNILLPAAMHPDQTPRIDPAHHTLRAQLIGHPTGPDPQNRPLHMCGNHHRQTAPRAAANLMRAGQRQFQIGRDLQHGTAVVMLSS